MSISGKVARLLSGERHLGSAWLISPTHALTAAHCAADSDDEWEPALNLMFHGHSEPVQVDVDNVDTVLIPDLDVAVLAINTGNHELDDRVINMSERQSVRFDKCFAHGHPLTDVDVNPDGMTISVKVVNPAHLYQLKSNPVKVIHLAFPSTQAKLHGLSGSPVFCTFPGNEDLAIGIVSENRQVDPSNMYAVPILEIAQQSDVVQQALCKFLQARECQKTLCIRVTNGHQVSWSAPITPSEAHLLWSEGGPVDKINCHAKLNQMRPVDRAMMRMINHAHLKELASPDYGSCCTCMGRARTEVGLGGCPPYPGQPKGCDHGLPLESEESGAVCITLAKEELAEALHEAMDTHTLDYLHDQFSDCLYNGNLEGRELEIENDLRITMWDIWETWYPRLKEEKEIRRQFFVRVLSASGQERPDGEALIRIGRLSHQDIFLTTLFCLALAASEVPLQLGSSEAGNFTMGEENAHACGIKKFKGNSLNRRIGENQWTTRFVVLPNLEELYSGLLNNMVKYAPDSAPRLDAPGGAPVVITGDSGFVSALRNGVEYIRKYFEDRRNEAETTPLPLGPRIK